MSELYLSQSVHLLLCQNKEKRKVVKVACFISASNQSIQGVLFTNVCMWFNTQSLSFQKTRWTACVIRWLLYLFQHKSWLTPLKPRNITYPVCFWNVPRSRISKLNPEIEWPKCYVSNFIAGSNGRSEAEYIIAVYPVAFKLLFSL